MSDGLKFFPPIGQKLQLISAVGPIQYVKAFVNFIPKNGWFLHLLELKQE